MKPDSEILSAIRESVGRAASAYGDYMRHFQNPKASEYSDEQKDNVAWFLNSAFLNLRLFLEVKAVPHMLLTVAADHSSAEEDFMKAQRDPWGEEPSSFWANRLQQYLRAMDVTFGATAISTVTRDLVGILRNAQYSLTDKVFPAPPKDEREVHARMEAILRCVFQDLRHEPTIGKPIKNFKPDTGLPSIKMLIEYKFVATPQDVAPVSDQVLADTRAYVDKDWDHFVLVVYETRRLRSERVWNDHLRSCDIGDNTQIVVLCGEEPVGGVEKIDSASREGGHNASPAL